jgi:hypothetical protein
VAHRDLAWQLGDGLVEDDEVVGDVVRAGVARPQRRGQQLAGRVREQEQRVEAVAALVGRAGAGLLLGVDLDEGGVDVEHDRRTPGRRCAAVPDLGPHVRDRALDLVPRRRRDLVEGAPQRRVRGNEPKEALLGAQVLDVAARLAPAGEHRHRMNEHLAAVMQRGTLARPRDRGRELVAETKAVRERAQRVEPDVGDDPGPSGSDDDGTRAGSFHLGDAFRCGSTVA